MCHTNENVNSIAENVTRIKIGKMINVGAFVKIQNNIMRANKIIFGIFILTFLLISTALLIVVSIYFAR